MRHLAYIGIVLGILIIIAVVETASGTKIRLGAVWMGLLIGLAVFIANKLFSRQSTKVERKQDDSSSPEPTLMTPPQQEQSDEKERENDTEEASSPAPMENEHKEAEATSAPLPTPQTPLAATAASQEPSRDEKAKQSKLGIAIITLLSGTLVCMVWIICLLSSLCNASRGEPYAGKLWDIRECAQEIERKLVDTNEYLYRINDSMPSSPSDYSSDIKEIKDYLQDIVAYVDELEKKLDDIEVNTAETKDAIQSRKIPMR